MSNSSQSTQAPSSGRYALLIGSTTYSDPSRWPSLPWAGIDVEKLGNLLENPDLGNFEVTRMVDEPSNRVSAAIEVFFSNRLTSDLLLLYFSGHAEPYMDQLCLIMPDTDPARIGASSISSSFVGSLLRYQAGKAKVVILDCCYAGRFVQGLYKGGVGEQSKPFKRELEKGKGLFFVGASSSTTPARVRGPEDGVDQSDLPSVFTRALIEGIESGEADRDKNGRIDLSELVDHARDCITKWRIDATPTHTDLNAASKVDIAFVPNGAKSPEREPGLKPQARAGWKSPVRYFVATGLLLIFYLCVCFLRWPLPPSHALHIFGSLVSALVIQRLVGFLTVPLPNKIYLQAACGCAISTLVLIAGFKTLSSAAPETKPKTGGPSHIQVPPKEPSTPSLIKVLAPSTWTNKPGLRIHVVNVGQASTTIIEAKCGIVLFDVGYGNDSTSVHLISYLKALLASRPDLKSTIETVFISHGHKDHTAALYEIVNQFRVKRLVLNGVVEGSGAFDIKKTLKYIKDQRAATTVHSVFNSDIGAFGVTDSRVDSLQCTDCDPEVRVIAGGHKTNPGLSASEFRNANLHSLVVKVSIGKGSFLFTGDLETPGLTALVSKFGRSGGLNADVLLVGHHGSRRGVTSEFLTAVSPALAAISCGRPFFGDYPFSSANYGHPNMAVCDMLQAAISGARTPVMVLAATSSRTYESYMVRKALYCTGWDGDIRIDLETDGSVSAVYEGD